MTVQKREHYKERIAHANGAEIECLSSGANPLWVTLSEPTGLEHRKYRIKPDCKYAIEEIRKLGGDEAVELYTYWLKGGGLEIIPDDHSVYIPLTPSRDFANPLGTFKHELECGIKFRKKKRTVKQVLWVRAVNSSGLTYCRWVDKDVQIKCPDWHKVPTCTREVEVD